MIERGDGEVTAAAGTPKARRSMFAGFAGFLAGFAAAGAAALVIAYLLFFR